MDLIQNKNLLNQSATKCIEFDCKLESLEKVKLILVYIDSTEKVDANTSKLPLIHCNEFLNRMCVLKWTQTRNKTSLGTLALCCIMEKYVIQCLL